MNIKIYKCLAKLFFLRDLGEGVGREGNRKIKAYAKRISWAIF